MISIAYLQKVTLNPNFFNYMNKSIAYVVVYTMCGAAMEPLSFYPTGKGNYAAERHNFLSHQKRTAPHPPFNGRSWAVLNYFYKDFSAS